MVIFLCQIGYLQFATFVAEDLITIILKCRPWLQAPHTSKTPIQGVKKQGYPEEREEGYIKNKIKMPRYFFVAYF